MKTKLEVIRLTGNDVITTSTLCDLDDGTHVYIGGQCPNDYGIHPGSTHYFIYKNGSWNEGSETYLTGQYGSVDKGWYHLEGVEYEKCNHPTPEDEPNHCLNS